MPRHAREKGEFSTYHIIQRGNERKSLFNSDDDKLRFIGTLERIKRKYDIHVYAFCLMDNHIHLLIYDNGNDISQVIKSMNISYAYYFNRVNKRIGHLFQDRFKSELVDSDEYLLEVSKYIHRNPVKARIVKDPEMYKWSSYNIYTGKAKNFNDLVEVSRILGMLSEKYGKAVKDYIKYVNSTDGNEAGVMDVDDDIVPEGLNSDNNVYTLVEAKKKIEEMAEQKGISFERLIGDKQLRNEAILYTRRASTLTLKQIGELFGGISESRVSRILSKQ